MTPDSRREALLLAEREGRLPPVLAFWDHTPTGPGTGPWVLSQWWPAPFTVDGVRYPTAEHWMMAAKARHCGDDDALARVLADPSPEVAKAVGRQVRGFDSAAWAAVAYGVVVEGNRHRFAPGPEREYLRATGDRVLVEASPVDRVWGVGLGEDDPRHASPAQWQGQNLLGLALMEVRESLGS